MLYTKYKLPVIGIVIYAGKDPVNMRTRIEYENFNYQYQIIDLSEYNPYEFLNSIVPEEIIMAIVAGKPTLEQARLLIKNILNKLHVLLENNISEFNTKVYPLEILSEVKNFQKIIIEEEKNMAFTLDNNNSVRYQAGLKDGLEKVVKNILLKGKHSTFSTFFRL